MPLAPALNEPSIRAQCKSVCLNWAPEKAAPFLEERLEQNQPLVADALTQLGAQRASAILAALKEAGVDPARALAAAPEKVSSDVDKPVPLKLGLAAK